MKAMLIVFGIFTFQFVVAVCLGKCIRAGRSRGRSGNERYVLATAAPKRKPVSVLLPWSGQRIR